VSFLLLFLPALDGVGAHGFFFIDRTRAIVVKDKKTEREREREKKIIYTTSGKIEEGEQPKMLSTISFVFKLLLL